MKHIYIAGPRIQDLGGFDGNDLQNNIKANIKRVLSETSDILLLTRLNLGIETWAAEIAFSLRVPYLVFIPFKDPHSKWPLPSRQTYSNLLKHAQHKIVLDTGSFSPAKLTKAENTMIEKADDIYSLFPDDGNWTIKMAKKMKRNIINILPSIEEDDYYIKL